MSEQLTVWKIEYEGGFTSTSGKAVKQDITEWLLCTPHALLKFKVCKNKGTDRVRVFTDVQAQGRLLDVGAIKRHDYYRRMWKAAGHSPLNPPQQEAIRDFAHFMEVSGIEPLITGDEKAQNAVMTAMGHNGELMLQSVVEKAREETILRRQAEVKAAIDAKTQALLADAGWGVF